jgi:chromosome segregation ATPase
MKMAFSLNYLRTKLNDAQKALTEAVVAWDPEGATEAQIAEYSEKVDELARVASKAQRELEEDKNKATVARQAFELKRKAAGILSGKIDATTEGDTAKAQTLETSLNSLVDELETLKAEVADLEAMAADSEAYYNERVAKHALGVDKLKKARSALAQAVREQQRAKDFRERQEERKAEANAAAGVSDDLDTVDIALNAMKRNSAKDREAANAARMTADALSTGTAADAEIAVALAEAAGEVKPAVSARDRLKNL